MLIFRYDKTFEGLLTAIFDAYSIKRFPDVLLAEEETPPLFYDEIITVIWMREEVTGYGKDFKKNYPPRPLPVLQPAGYPNSRR